MWAIASSGVPMQQFPLAAYCSTNSRDDWVPSTVFANGTNPAAPKYLEKSGNP
ncbi:Uncharacterised protein [Mycobacterium tuberculosis]|uniref:Uncharacterized protein n=1 Tax=Mycobacterium tuberculosis TaxID=1773 RepID=A0A655FZZ0_MYCTX|nr:Uncharacterised protein [Mycobacterium tuberculosis]CNV56222.1 Uncharacterised protein [Mycobacterium tuberculosis]CNV58062.1 Uncharacterised protein [Mycobacterium tuberculosis]CNW67484.1 Uncharacterised protein [Mycobacterium tuberculosis]COY81286.1 Uncharacterised protein [Mycobacterium tuberculosis]